MFCSDKLIYIFSSILLIPLITSHSVIKISFMMKLGIILSFYFFGIAQTCKVEPCTCFYASGLVLCRKVSKIPEIPDGIRDLTIIESNTNGLTLSKIMHISKLRISNNFNYSCAEIAKIRQTKISILGTDNTTCTGIISSKFSCFSKPSYIFHIDKYSSLHSSLPPSLPPSHSLGSKPFI